MTAPSRSDADTADRCSCSAPLGRGIATTSQPLAVQAALTILDQGGSAADAAVAAAAMLCVVEPRATGIGGDAFALYWPASADRPYGLEGAGPAPAALSIESLKQAGFTEMPTTGPWTVTVPGSVSLWCRLVSRFGRLDLKTVLRAAIRTAREGFEVTPVIADEWAMHAHRIAEDEAAARIFLPDGKAPASGQRFANPAMGETLARIAAEGEEWFYRGEAADQIAAAVEAAGGPLRREDLAEWSGATWVQPISGTYRDLEIIEMPPPGQGVVALKALAILEKLSPLDRAEEEHFALEALKSAFADARDRLADPRLVDVDLDGFLGEQSAAAAAREIGPRASHKRAPGPATDTVYLAVVDGDGNACSLIQSLYSGFGSGVGVEGLGITLQNRGKGFVMEAGHPNAAEGGKRPYHTIIPAMLARNGSFAGCLGVVGGFMQPQAQAQIIRRLVDDGCSPLKALAAPRLRFLDGDEIGAEPDFDPGILRQLEARGHRISSLSNFKAGGAQLIVRTGEGHEAASEPRKDGTARSQ